MRKKLEDNPVTPEAAVEHAVQRDPILGKESAIKKVSVRGNYRREVVTTVGFSSNSKDLSQKEMLLEAIQNAISPDDRIMGIVFTGKSTIEMRTISEYYKEVEIHE